MTGRKCTLCLQFIISWYQTFVTRCQTPTYARTIIHCCVCLCLFLLQVRIKTAKRRVVMASLYLGTGQLEQELVRNVLFVRSRFFFLVGVGGGIYVSLISVRWEQCRPNTGACQIVGQRCQKTVSQCCLPGEPQCGLFKMKAHARPATRNDPRMQGFMGIRRPVLACDSPLFFMLGKPSITTLTQNKPQSGLMLRFSCFSWFFFEARTSSRITEELHRRVKHA